MNGWICEQCGSDEWNVTRFELFGKNEPRGERKLCGSCKWSYIEKRLRPDSEPEPEPEPTGQVSLLDF